MDRGKAHLEPVRWPKVVTSVARIRYERLRLATAEVPEKFLMYTRGQCIPKKTHERGRGVYPLGATLPPPDRLGAVLTLVRGMGLLRSSR